MISTNEFQIFIWAAGVILAANVLIMLMFILHAKLPASTLKSSIHSIIYWLDEQADEMSNADKKRDAIRQINEVLGWRRVLIPAAVIGWIIDAEVAAIRKMQAATDTPDLHREG